MAKRKKTTRRRDGVAEQLAPDVLLGLMEHLVLVREFERACERLWADGERMIGEFHLSLGQEAIAVGTCAAVEPDDPICPSIRGMGVYLCRDVPMVGLMASFFDRQDGISEGRWPHWHSPVPERHILPLTGMLGSSVVTSAGVALTHKLRGSDRVVAVMIGDGTTNTGYFHEGMNFAAAQDLPMVCIIENNQYAVSTPISEAARAKDLSSRAVGYGIPGITVDGNDVRAVYGAVREAVVRARRDGGPTLIECKTYRWSGQVLGDPDTLRPQAEKEAAQKDCPVLALKDELSRQGALSEAGYAKMVSDAGARIGNAIDAARALPALDAGADPLRDYWPYAESGEVPA